MRLPLEPRECECLKLIYNDKLSCEESAEVVIPDTCADAGRILDVRGQALMTSKRAVSEGVVVSACVEADVIFATEEAGAPQCVSVKLPFEFSAIAKGADDDSQVVASLELCKLEARMLNPRKLLIRAELNADIKVYKEDVFVIWNDLPEAGEMCVRLLKEEVGHALVIGVGEKSFTVSDEYNMPEGERNARIISCVTQVCADDVKSVGNKLVFKATARTNAAFMSSDGNIFAYNFETQFSQIIESEEASDDTQVDIILSLLSADFVALPERDDGAIAANFKIAVQAVCISQESSGYIADAYSNRYPLTLETASVPIFTAQPPRMQKLRLEGEPENGVEEVVYAYCGGVCTEVSDGKVSFCARVSGIGKNEDGDLMPINALLKGAQEHELERNCQLSIGNVCFGGLSVMHNGAVSLELTYELMTLSKGEVEAVSAIEIDVENPVDNESKPSIIVLCSKKDASLWAIAKKYSSTIEAIEAANSVDGEFSATMRPLIIPKS